MANIAYVRVSSADQNGERQAEGIALAKQRGAYKGRKKLKSRTLTDIMRIIWSRRSQNPTLHGTPVKDMTFPMRKTNKN